MNSSGSSLLRDPAASNRPAQGGLRAESASSPSPPSPLPLNTPVSSNPLEINVVAPFVSDSRLDSSSKVGFPNGSGSSVVIFNEGVFTGDKMSEAVVIVTRRVDPEFAVSTAFEKPETLGLVQYSRRAGELRDRDRYHATSPGSK